MGHAGGGWLESDDLIQDREIEDGESDRLGHGHLAGQLHHLVSSVSTPTNIAVWGPWGSGKSGVANLLRAELAKERGARFVRFDAFKYAENPLRRTFISAVATALNIKDKKYHQDLYSGQVTATVEFRGKDVWKLLSTYIQMFALIASGSVTVVAILAWLKHGPFRRTFVDMAVDVLQAGLAPAALLTSLTVLVSRTLTREHRTDAANSDEEFERIFSALVAQSGVERLVIFVDELDRCAPSDVVATLDALRTFLGVERCVFVVAADQQVLEEALTRALAQATPADSVNPYYSSGSGYLDKVFPYQVGLPPLLVGRIASYAAGLVRGRGGVWAKVDIDLIVSVLVPSHVRSPRRVKALLNAFVLSYRLAEQRAAEGMLDTDPSARAEEIARLVCLRVEFPLFARDLLLDHRLCDYVVRLADDSNANLDGFVSEQVKNTARAYAAVRAPVDVHLSETISETDEGTETPRASHGRQLVAYLRKTRRIAGPGRDLIFMQTGGSVFGLPSALAETIERHAQNADLGALRSVVEDLDAQDQAAVLSLLAQQAREAIGLEGWNVALGVLAICANPEFPLNGGADAALENVTTHLAAFPQEVPAEVVPGCWRLARASNRDTARDLRKIALRHSDLDEDADLAMLVLSDASTALSADAERVEGLLTNHLLSGAAEKVAEMLHKLVSVDAESLMETCASRLTLEISAAIESHDAWVKVEKQHAAALAAGTSVADIGDEPRSPDMSLDALASVLEHWHEAEPNAARTIVRVLLEIDDRSARNVLERHLAYIPMIGDVSLARLVLANSSRRATDMWPKWLGFLSPDLDLAAVGSGIESMYAILWARAIDADSPLDSDIVVEAANAFVRLIGDRPLLEHPSIADIVLESIEGFAQSDEEAAERNRAIAAMQPLLDSGLLDRGTIIRHETAAVTATLTDPDVVEPLADGELLTYLAVTAADCLHDFNMASEHPLSLEQVAALLNAVDSCGWLPEPRRTPMRIACRLNAGAQSCSQIQLDPMPTASQIAAYARQHPGRGASTVANWIRLEKPSPTEMCSATAKLMKSSHGADLDSLAVAIRDRLSEFPGGEQAEYWRELIGAARALPSVGLLTSAGWSQLPDMQSVELLVDRYNEAGNRSERQAVLDLWHAAAITSDAAQRVLLDSILIPMLGTNQTAADQALGSIPRLIKKIPSGRKAALRQAVEGSYKSFHQLEKKAISVLKEIGYGVERYGLLRRERIRQEDD